MTAAFLLLVFWLGALAFFVFAVAAGARAVRRNADAKNRVVRSVPTNAPDNWYGSHEPEAKLHRRVRDAVAGLSTIVGDDDTMNDTLRSVEREAVALDDQLVANSVLPHEQRDSSLPALEEAVSDFENITAGLISRSSGLDRVDIKGELDKLAERLDLLDEARAELDEEGGATSP